MKLTIAGTIAGIVSIAVLVMALGQPGLAGANAPGAYLTATPSRTPYTSPPESPTPRLEPVFQGSITVVGVGKVTVVPDVVQIQLGVETISDTVAAATVENDKVMDAVLAALKKEGVAEKDIQTSYYSIYPEYDQRRVGDEVKPSQIVGYRVSNSVSVVIRDTQGMEKVSAVLEAVVEAGANNVGGITFTLDDPQAVEDQARALAVADAKRRAEDLARLTGVTLGQVTYVSEVITGSPIPMSREMAVPAAVGGGPGILPGEQDYSVSIQITYAIP